MSQEAIRVIEEKCVGCKLCIKACPFGAITVGEDRIARIDMTRCTLCGACVPACKFDAIAMAEKKAGGKDWSEYRDVWVFAEQDCGKVQSVTFELLGEGRKLADALGMKLCAVLLGHNVTGGAADLIRRGADRVYVVDRPELEGVNTPEEQIAICQRKGGIGDNEPVEEGVGLTNTRARLHGLYGEAHRFELRRGPEGGLLARLTIPLRLENTPHENSNVDRG
jgi:Fe-S-cluster-containing hydrogenase component 2